MTESSKGAAVYGGDEVIDFVVDHGQEWVFGVIGSNSTAMFEAIASRPVKYLQAVHEASAIAMADGYSRVRGEATCLVYMEPGGANGLNSTYVAWTDESPVLVVISDQDSRVKNGTAGLLEVDLVRVTEPFTRQSRMLPENAPVRLWLERSRRVSRGARGPVVLAIPQNILNSPTTPTPAYAVPPVHRELSAPDDVSAVVEALRAARNPLLVAGGQVRRLGGAAVLQQISEEFAIPVAHDVGFQDRLAMTPWHPHFVGPVLLPVLPDPVPHAADVVVVVGSRFFTYVHGRPDDRFFPNASFIAHVNADPTHLDEAELAHWTSCAGPRGFLQKLYDGLAAHPTADSLLQQRREWISTAKQHLSPDPDHPLVRAAAPLHDALEHGWLVDESTASCNYTIGSFRSGDPGRYLAAGSGSLGWGPSAACGVAAGSGGPVTCTIGDGALRFGLHGLWTAQAYQLPITFYVYDNRTFGSTEMFATQTSEAMGRTATFTGSDFSHFNRGIADTLDGFGIPTISVGLDDDIRAALTTQWAGASRGPNAVVIDVGLGPHP